MGKDQNVLSEEIRRTTIMFKALMDDGATKALDDFVKVPYNIIHMWDFSEAGSKTYLCIVILSDKVLFVRIFSVGTRYLLSVDKEISGDHLTASMVFPERK